MRSAPAVVTAADTDPRDAQIARLRKRLRASQAALRDARAELAARPPVPEDEPLTPDEIRHLHKQFEPNPKGETCGFCGRIHRGACETCGGLHAHACPRVRSVEYETHGDRVMIKRVEYWPGQKWSRGGIMFPDELPPLPGEASAPPALPSPVPREPTGPPRPT